MRSQLPLKMAVHQAFSPLEFPWLSITFIPFTQFYHFVGDALWHDGTQIVPWASDRHGSIHHQCFCSSSPNTSGLDLHQVNHLPRRIYLVQADHDLRDYRGCEGLEWLRQSTSVT